MPRSHKSQGYRDGRKRYSKDNQANKFEAKEKLAAATIQASIIDDAYVNNPDSQLILAFPEYIEELRQELRYFKVPILAETCEAFLIPSNKKNDWIWASAIWSDIRKASFESVNDAAKILKAYGLDWSKVDSVDHRRAELILAKLPKRRLRPIEFKFEEEDQRKTTSDTGQFMLIDRETMLFSEQTNTILPALQCKFNEDRHQPPSRAYLKLWELFQVHGIRPKASDRVLDMGCAPGGWTWVLAELGCEVIAIDKAPLDESLMTRDNIDYRCDSAFGLRPQHIGPIDWFYSDIICYPEKLLKLVTRWHESGLVKNFACSIKFQSATDYELLKEFKKFPNSQIIHLYHNKHECTWISQS